MGPKHLIEKRSLLLFNFLQKITVSLKFLQMIQAWSTAKEFWVFDGVLSRFFIKLRTLEKI